MEDPALSSVERKLDELIFLVEASSLDQSSRRKIQQKMNTALKLGADADDPGNGLQQFFHEHKTDTRAARKNRLATTLGSIVRLILALLLVCLGFGMIIMPAPPYFEMFTLFTIPGSNGNDGVTIMDVISLIVAFSGVSIFISTIIRFNK